MQRQSYDTVHESYGKNRPPDPPQTMKRKSKNSEEYNQPSEQELLNRINNMREPYKSYAAFSYLFGNRVSEGIGGKSKYKTRGIDNIREYKPILAGDITIENGWIEVTHVPTLKRKVRDINKFYRDMIVLQTGQGEKPFINILLQHIENKRPEEPLWTHNRRTQWYHCNKHLQIPPKVLRSLRAKKDAKVYHLGALELKEKYNWGSTDMPFFYAKYNKEALKKKMEESQ